MCVRACDTMCVSGVQRGIQEKLESVYQSSQEKARDQETKMEAERGRVAQVSGS